TATLRERGVAVRARELVAERIGQAGCAPALDNEIAETDFVVVFGGDGTLLAAARLVAPHGTPILGIHLGHFGFITEAPPDNLFSAVDAALEGRAIVEERMMLAGQVIRGDNAPDDASCQCTLPDSLLGMNDMVVASSAVRIVHITARIGGDLLATYAADGVIVASPTGSTGYSLSAGGPLVHPSVPGLIITPICAHTLNARALVIPDTETVHLTVEAHSSQGDGAVVSVDGQIETPLYPGDAVVIRRSPHRVKVLSVGGPNFYQKIRSKWHYGERIAADHAP
ncbi:MAG: NAD(+)/NADH kinase, partial [Cytophagales bacterium]|nr:NAD(+)/NADH kinase [Armatimonadota bacterium]